MKQIVQSPKTGRLELVDLSPVRLCPAVLWSVVPSPRCHQFRRLLVGQSCSRRAL